MNSKSFLVITLVFILSICTLLVFSVNMGRAHLSITTGICGASNNAAVAKADSKLNIVSCSVMIDNASDFDALSTWLSSLNYRNFTFVIWSCAENYVLSNSTRLNILETYGRIIPRLEYMQQYDTRIRRQIIDGLVANYTIALGHMPDGVMEFQPDTFSDNYLRSLRLNYTQGYCFDQYCIDHMSMRGGWQLPYYSNDSNSLVPATDNSGLVVLPHSTWDWIDSFTITHNLHLHPMNLVDYFNGSIASAKAYFLGIIDNTLNGTYPFGFCQVQFEWSWCVRTNLTDIAEDWINTLLTRTQPEPYVMWDFSTLVNWFRATYSSNPVYTVHFTSPNSQNSIDWYFDEKCRIAREGSSIVSFVDYTKQSADAFLHTNRTIDWTSNSLDPNDCIITDLQFTINALGNGTMRARITTSPYSYSGNLSGFYDYYYSHLNSTNIQTGVFVILAIGSVLIIVTVQTLISKRKRRPKHSS